MAANKFAAQALVSVKNVSKPLFGQDHLFPSSTTAQHLHVTGLPVRIPQVHKVNVLTMKTPFLQRYLNPANNAKRTETKTIVDADDITRAFVTKRKDYDDFSATPPTANSKRKLHSVFGL